MCCRHDFPPQAPVLQEGRCAHWLGLNWSGERHPGGRRSGQALPNPNRIRRAQAHGRAVSAYSVSCPESGYAVRRWPARKPPRGTGNGRRAESTAGHL